MITTRLVGRLGNSLYQIAACIAYARKFNYGHNWAVPYEPTGDAGMKSAIHNVYPNLPKTGDRPRSWPRDGYEPRYYDYFEMANQGADVLLAGFWQSYKWWAHCEEEVKKTFELPHVPGYEDYVSIHVRRGDYVHNAGSFPPLTMEYITDALGVFARPEVKTKVLVFSDDIQWCKDNFSGLNYWFDFTYSEGRSEREDLQLMMSCGDHVTSNSSFAWWGAYLGHNANRTIVCPHHTEWYGASNGIVQFARSMGSEPCKDLIPEGWIEIKRR